MNQGIIHCLMWKVHTRITRFLMVFAMKYSGSLLSFGGQYNQYVFLVTCRNFSLHPTWKSTNQPPGNQVRLYLS